MQEPGGQLECCTKCTHVVGERRRDWAPHGSHRTKRHGLLDHELPGQSNWREDGHSKRSEPGHHRPMSASYPQTKTRISEPTMKTRVQPSTPVKRKVLLVDDHACEIGRASCRERVQISL